ncbi:hypothetical protein GCM10010975_13550 [Comamonas phosphati]|nr:hypothetical protein GCM10010975_13550 [Comamonas phosphati]
MTFQKASSGLVLAGLILSAGFSVNALAQDPAAKPAAPADQTAGQAPAAQPQVDAAAADAALKQRLQAVVAAINGKSKLAAGNFNEQFTKESPVDAVQKALDSMRSGVGNCQPTARMQTSNPIATSVLLSCQKGFVPLEIAVEPQAPYRITGMLLHPAYWK